MSTVGKGTRPIAGVVAEQVLALAAHGAAIEVIARKLGTSRYRVEQLVGVGPAGRDDVPYRYRELFAQSEISARYRAGESAERIAYDLGISVTTVFAVLHREGAVLRGKCDTHRTSYADVLTGAFLQMTYVEAGMGAWEIAAEVGCSESTVRNWLRRHGIPVRPIRTRRRAYAFSADLLDQVSSGVLAVEAAAGLVGCSRSELTRALRRAGRTLPHERRVELTHELLVTLYVDQARSCPEISAGTGWAIGTVRSRLRQSAFRVGSAVLRSPYGRRCPPGARSGSTQRPLSCNAGSWSITRSWTSEHFCDASAGHATSSGQATVERPPSTVVDSAPPRSAGRRVVEPDSLETLMRIDDPTTYNPFGWRLAEIADAATDDSRRRELVESLVICEAEELVLGRRHVTIVHGEPDRLADSVHLTEFYDTIAGLASAADWTRVRGTSDYVTATFAGSNAERMVSLVTTAAERANPGWWEITESPYPDIN